MTELPEEEKELPPGATGLDEKETGSAVSGSDVWQSVTEDGDTGATSEVFSWQKKAEEEEASRMKLEAEAREWRLQWQKQAEEAETREAKTKEELKTWQDKATEQGTKRADAEAALGRCENRAERAESLRQMAEREASDLREKAAQAEGWRKRWQEKAEVEEKLRGSWQQKAKAAQAAVEEADLLKEEAKLRQKAEAEAAEWQEKARREESCRKRLEEEVQQCKKRAKEEETLRRQCEKKSEVEEDLRKSWQYGDTESKRQRIAAQTKMEVEAAALVWQSEKERLEKEIGKLKEKVAEKERLRKMSETKASGLASDVARMKEAQEEAALVHRYSYLGLRRVTHLFKGLNRARTTNSRLFSPDFSVEVPENKILSQSFKLVLLFEKSFNNFSDKWFIFWSPTSFAPPSPSDLKLIKIVFRVFPAKTTCNALPKMVESALEWSVVRKPRELPPDADACVSGTSRSGWGVELPLPSGFEACRSDSVVVQAELCRKN